MNSANILIGYLIVGLLLPNLFGSEEQLPSVEEILERAIERADWYRENGVDQQLHAFVVRTSQKLDEQGQVKESEESRYRTVPVNGFVYERLIEKDGKPLSEKSARDEAVRETEFREKVTAGRNPYEEGNHEMSFDRQLVSKYDFTLEGMEEIAGRPAYVLSFKPKSEDLPVETRMDRALNRASGKVWLDREVYELSRAEFELDEKIKIWWGIIGSISRVDGMIERKPVESGIWAPDRFQIYLKGRILFSSIHKIEKVDWQSWELLSADNLAIPWRQDDSLSSSSGSELSGWVD